MLNCDYTCVRNYIKCRELKMLNCDYDIYTEPHPEVFIAAIENSSWYTGYQQYSST